MIKTHNTLEIEDNFLNPANGTYKKCTANILNGERLHVFSLRLGTIQGCLLFPPLFIIALEVLAMTGKTKKEKASRLERLEVKLSLFTDDMILYRKS